jgi:hypothetical protein
VILWKKLLRLLAEKRTTGVGIESKSSYTFLSGLGIRPSIYHNALALLPLAASIVCFPDRSSYRLPLPWPRLRAQRWLSMCGLGGVTCPGGKRGPLHNAKTRPRPTHPLVRRAITPKHARQSITGMAAGSTNRAMPTKSETPSMKPFLARIVCLFRHDLSRELLPLSHRDVTLGLGRGMTMAIGPWPEIMEPD